MGTFLIRGAKQLLTLRGPQRGRRGAELNDLGIIPDGALLIRDGVVKQVGPSRRLENLREAGDAVEIDATGRVVMPGFVDSHTHVAFPPPGTSEPQLSKAMTSIRSNSTKRLAAITRSYLEAMARHGTTTVEVKTGCGPDEGSESKLLRALGTLKREPVSVVRTLLLRLPAADCAAVAERYCRELLPLARRRRLAQFADVAWESERCLNGPFTLCAETLQREGFGGKLHADRANIGYAIDVAACHGFFSMDHLEHATPEEVAALARSAAVATLMPVPYRGPGRCAPARAMIDAGAAVALASDFHPLRAPTFNMQTVVAMACLELDLTPEEAISAATINGAHALGRGNCAGSLEVGKAADLIMLNVPDYRELAHYFGVNLVHLTMKGGELIYREGAVAPQKPRAQRLA